MNIEQALNDPRIFGSLPAFSNLGTWARWLVVLKAIYGLPLTSGEQQIFCKFTGLPSYDPPPGGWPVVVIVVGRQSGKTRIAGTLIDFAAIQAQREADGTDVYALAIAQDERASKRALLSYARAPFELVPVLAQSVVGQTADAIQLNTGVTIAAYPCRPAAVRGLRAAIVVLDELAFYRSSENLPLDLEMLRAVRPTLATTGGKLVIISSPGAQSGELYRLHRQYFSQPNPHTLVWQASAPEMNPTLPTDYLERIKQDDPEAYRAEVLGEFRVGITTFLDPAAIQDCVAPGIRERAPADSVQRYVAFCDPSGGRRDRFTLGIAHKEGERAILDALRAWAPPFNPSGVIQEVAELLRQYRITEIRGDRYGAEFVVEQFRACGIRYTPSDLDRSAIYLEVLPLINSGSAVLLDHAELLRELRGLERRRRSSGKDAVDHAPGAHDDLANSCAGALVLAGTRPANTGLLDFYRQEAAALRAAK